VNPNTHAARQALMQTATQAFHRAFFTSVLFALALTIPATARAAYSCDAARNSTAAFGPMDTVYSGTPEPTGPCDSAFIRVASVSATPESTLTAVLSIDRPETGSASAIAVTSPVIKNDGTIPEAYSAYGDNLSPALHWAAANGAKSYMVVVQDPDAKGPMPVVHWTIWNISAATRDLPKALQAAPQVIAPTGFVQGKTSHGGVGYSGPHPPMGDSPHHYHFQVFALDTMLNAPAGADLEQVLAAAKGHVIAKGELVGLFQQPRTS
jgi:Raf kinase inhibitor-like YbhB/YbcL family protein